MIEVELGYRVPCRLSDDARNVQPLHPKALDRDGVALVPREGTA